MHLPRLQSSNRLPPKRLPYPFNYLPVCSDRPSDYVVGRPIGFGASSIVYAATLSTSRSAVFALRTQSFGLGHITSTLLGSPPTRNHSNVTIEAPQRSSLAADVMRYGWPGGMEEEVIKCILEQALQGLNYLHINGFIHRDVKAANLLIDDDGTVLLGDLGVAADLSEGSSAYTLLGILIKRSNGTKFTLATANTHSQRPKNGETKVIRWNWKQYDSAADIWSFGITALELTQGRAPRSREPAQKVLLRTIQDDPPTLDRDGGTHKYSKAFQEMVESCLAKDPSKRPTAESIASYTILQERKEKIISHQLHPKISLPLTKRQERRILSNSQIHRSVDSWDFTIHSVPVSPTSPTSKRKGLETMEPSTVFEIEAEFDSQAPEDPLSAEPEQLPTSDMNDTTTPIPISKVTSSLRPATPQDDLSTSPASVMSSISSHASSLFKKDRSLSSSSASSFTSSSSSQGGLWSRLKGKKSLSGAKVTA
ncbi:kinase-like protein [Gymnopus androsaceus JB14]|uniref:Kinase-like protein n=1 Tax=Gymnopus androsaceus JB14 TaxID=1447944 RepID=A0A6A4IMJ5_9AGAR|nr:kinase-like protein [Gymnopus androsaceus JB14]